MNLSRVAMLGLLIIGISTLYLNNIVSQRIDFYQNYEVNRPVSYFDHVVASSKFNLLQKKNSSSSYSFEHQPYLRSKVIGGKRYLLVGNILDKDSNFNVIPAKYDLLFSKARSFSTPEINVEVTWDSDVPKGKVTVYKTRRLENRKYTVSNFDFEGVFSYGH